MNVIVVGTGYVGLPTGAVLAYLGHKVTFVDNDQNKIGILQQGGVPIFEPGLSELMALAATNLRFTSSYDEAGIEDCDVVFIAVPTPTSNEGGADLSFVKAAAGSILRS
jgi:UDPglucose 6-dehydrogenase